MCSEGAVDTRALEQTLFNMLRQQQEPQGPEDQGNAGGGAGDRRGPPEIDGERTTRSLDRLVGPLPATNCIPHPVNLIWLALFL
eukprot:1156375-Pelagomonas_calceolata.AAC.4